MVYVNTAPSSDPSILINEQYINTQMQFAKQDWLSNVILFKIRCLDL